MKLSCHVNMTYCDCYDGEDSGDCSSNRDILVVGLTSEPTDLPSNAPTIAPSIAPTSNPIIYPTVSPSNYPTNNPTLAPTHTPSDLPSFSPTNAPNDEVAGLGVPANNLAEESFQTTNTDDLLIIPSTSNAHTLLHNIRWIKFNSIGIGTGIGIPINTFNS